VDKPVKTSYFSVFTDVDVTVSVGIQYSEVAQCHYFC